MAFFEDVAGGPEIDGQFVDLAGSDERRMLLRFAVAGAQNSFGEVLREAVGPDIDEFRGEIGVGCGRFGEEFDADWAGDFGVLRERRRRINQNVVAGFDGALIARTGGPVVAVAAERSADGWNWFCGVVSELIGAFFCGRGG